jgi:uncharacterized protein GlcG (DUF336 family)
VDDNRMVIAVVDRAGRPLGVFRKPQASDSDVEAALSLARTSAFFSHDMAPLSSRTVQTISRENFPNNVPNQPAAALFGIENTNRGCYLSDAYASGKTIPPATNLAGDGPGNGVTTQPGSIPVYKAGKMVGGIGVGGVEPNVAEFAAVASVDNQALSFVPVFPLPPPGAVFIDGIRLPFVEQTTQPAGTQPAAALQGAYVVGPRAGAAAADGWLVPPKGSATLSAAEVHCHEGCRQSRADARHHPLAAGQPQPDGDRRQRSARQYSRHLSDAGRHGLFDRCGRQQGAQRCLLLECCSCALRLAWRAVGNRRHQPHHWIWRAVILPNRHRRLGARPFP